MALFLYRNYRQILDKKGYLNIIILFLIFDTFNLELYDESVTKAIIVKPDNTFGNTEASKREMEECLVNKINHALTFLR